MRRSATFLLCCGLLLPLNTLSAQPLDTLRFPRPEAVNDPRAAYPLALLQLALDKAGSPAKLQPCPLPMQQKRALSELAKGQTLDVAWSMTTTEREQQLLPIRIPIYKGLIGWRIPLITDEQPDLLESVHNLHDLQALTAGQGHDWPDTEILRSNGLNVLGVPQYDSLFRMLSAHRFDYFPRAITEVWAEAALHSEEKLIVDRYLVLHYQAAVYFFVNKHNTALATVLNNGLESAISDGSFDRLFCQYFGRDILRARIFDRTEIRLQNPDLPKETPLQRPELWFNATSCR